MIDNLNNFLREGSREKNDCTVLVILDAKSLLTSIHHNYDIQAINFWLEKHPVFQRNLFSKV